MLYNLRGDVDLANRYMNENTPRTRAEAGNVSDRLQNSCLLEACADEPEYTAKRRSSGRRCVFRCPSIRKLFSEEGH